MATASKFTLKQLKERLENQELDLSLSALKEADVPVKEMKLLSHMNALDLSCNLLSALPAEICSFKQLVSLDVSKNQLRSLPENIGDLSSLKRLDLLGNRLTTLPESFGNLKNLVWLDVKDNPLSAPILKEAGDCLDDPQCKVCARRVVALMDYVHNGREQKRLEERLKLDQAERLRLEEERRQQKLTKQQEKEKRRLEFLTQRESLPTELAAPKIPVTAGEPPLQRSKELRPSTKPSTGPSWSQLFFSSLALSVVLVISVGISVHYFCDKNTTGSVSDLCEVELVRQTRSSIRQHVEPAVKAALDELGLLYVSMNKWLS